MSKKRENFYLPSRELRATINADGSRSITGLIAYNKPSEGLPWTETIAPGAFADALKPGADVLLLRDHQQEKLLARSLSKTLVLEDTPVGLKFTANLSSSNTVAADTLDSISRGDLSGVSFGFAVNDGGDSWSQDNQGVSRELRSVTLYEISVTSFAVFPDSSVSLRSVPKQYRSLLDSEDEDEDDDCECDEEDGECHCHDDDEEDDEDEEDWAERSLMRLALEQVRSYSAYLRSN